MHEFNSQEAVLVVLERIGERLTRPADAVLYGGSAIILMGRSDRFTDDIDLDCRNDKVLLETAKQVTDELGAVADLTYTVEEFIEVSPKLLVPHALYGHYGQLTVYLCDPAIIAASKLDRRSARDLEDIRWLLDARLLDPSRFRACVEACNEYDDKSVAMATMNSLLNTPLTPRLVSTKPAQRSPLLRPGIVFVITIILIALVVVWLMR